MIKESFFKPTKKFFSSLAAGKAEAMLPKNLSVGNSNFTIPSKTIAEIKKEAHDKAMAFIVKHGESNSAVDKIELEEAIKKAEKFQKFSVYG